MNQQEADALLAELARVEAQIAGLESRRAAALERIRSLYEAKIDPLMERSKEILAQLRSWAKKEAKNWTNRSITLPHGVIGFRLHPPALELQRGATWEGVLDDIRAYGLPEYWRVKLEVDKEALLAAAARGEDVSQFGLRVIQRESFYAVPKLD